MENISLQNPAKYKGNRIPPISSPPNTMNNPTSAAQNHKAKSATSKHYMPLLVITYVCLFVGSVSSSLLTKYYFNHKGSSIWLSSWVQSAGFPLLLIPIYIPYLLEFTERKPFSGFSLNLFAVAVLMGLILGISNIFFSFSSSYLPVSTLSLLLSTQLVFNLILSVIIVKQKVTFSNLNCVILLTLSSVLLAVDEKNEKPEGLTRSKYYLGFFFAISAGLLFAVSLPVMERIYRNFFSYGMVMEMQLVMEITATVLAMVGMAASGVFKKMKHESQHVFDKGPIVYWISVMSAVVTWQFSFMASSGMIFLTSSLTCAICMTGLLATNVLGGVVVYGDDFRGSKVVSTVLCLWGFCSYVYGMYVKMKKQEKKSDYVGLGNQIEINGHVETANGV